MKTSNYSILTITGLAVAGWLFLAGAAAEAQGRGGGSASGQRGSQGKAPVTQPRGGGQQGAGQQGAGMGAQDRDRIHLSDRQRDRFEDCSGAADRVQQQARSLAKSASGAGFRVSDLRQQRDRLHEEIQTMVRQHEEMMNGFGDADRLQLQDRTRKLDQARDRMHTCLGKLDDMLSRGNPAGEEVRREAREMERASRQWQKQYHKLGEELGVG